MALQEIDKGTGPNTSTGTNARLAADMINANFAYLLALQNRKVKIGAYWVEKQSGNTDLLNMEVGDKFEAWLETDTRYVVGKVIALPFDVDDDTKAKLVANNYI